MSSAIFTNVNPAPDKVTPATLGERGTPVSSRQSQGRKGFPAARHRPGRWDNPAGRQSKIRRRPMRHRSAKRELRIDAWFGRTKEPSAPESKHPARTHFKQHRRGHHQTPADPDKPGRTIWNCFGEVKIRRGGIPPFRPRLQEKILRSADFPICCIADFQSAGRGIFGAAGLAEDLRIGNPRYGRMQSCATIGELWPAPSALTAPRRLWKNRPHPQCGWR